jgi:hypothetical protein
MINKPASVRARLLNKAKAENQDFSLVLIQYGLERLLWSSQRWDTRPQVTWS